MEDFSNLTFPILRKVDPGAAHVETATVDGSVEDMHVQTRKIIDVYVGPDVHAFADRTALTPIDTRIYSRRYL